MKNITETVAYENYKNISAAGKIFSGNTAALLNILIQPQLATAGALPEAAQGGISGRDRCRATNGIDKLAILRKN